MSKFFNKWSNISSVRNGNSLCVNGIFTCFLIMTGESCFSWVLQQCLIFTVSGLFPTTPSMSNSISHTCLRKHHWSSLIPLSLFTMKVFFGNPVPAQTETVQARIQLLIVYGDFSIYCSLQWIHPSGFYVPEQSWSCRRVCVCVMSLPWQHMMIKSSTCELLWDRQQIPISPLRRWSNQKSPGWICSTWQHDLHLL